MDRQFKRILDLIRKTGDRLVVTDTDGQNAYVVMDLDHYETLVDLEGDYFDDDFSDFNDEDLGLYNDDYIESEEKSITLDENFNPIEELEDDYAPEKIDMLPPQEPASRSPKDIWQAMPPAGEQAPTWDTNQMGKNERQQVADQYQTYQESRQNKPNFNKKTQNQTPDEEFGEDQFYLEPIE